MLFEGSSEENIYPVYPAFLFFQGLNRKGWRRTRVGSPKLRSIASADSNCIGPLWHLKVVCFVARLEHGVGILRYRNRM